MIAKYLPLFTALHLVTRNCRSRGRVESGLGKNPLTTLLRFQLDLKFSR